MILSMEKLENDFDDHTLQNFVFNEIVQGDNLILTGFILPSLASFHESLNTLEFCLKFKNVMQSRQV